MSGWDKSPFGWENTHGIFGSKHHKQINNLHHNFDGIIVMAGGLTDSGFIHPWVENRLDLALKYYNTKKIEILCTGGGTYHKPPLLNKEKFVIHESTACAEYLMSNGVSPNNIIKEWGSYDTIASVYFSLLLVVYQKEWKDVCVISSSFHMERVKLLFGWINSFFEYEVNFVFEEVGDNDEEIISRRVEREKESVKNLNNIISRIRDKKAFNEWFFKEHKAYSCNFHNKRENIKDEEKRTY